MAGVRTRRHWPQLNRGHVMARGLRALIVPDGIGGVRDLCQPRGGAGTASNVGQQGPASQGWSVASSKIADLQFPSDVYSVAVAYNHVGTLASGDVPQVFGNIAYTSESVNSGWGFLLFGSGSTVPGYAFTAFHNSGTAGSTINGGTPTAGDHWLVGTHSATLGGNSLYLDGALLTSSVSRGNANASTGSLANGGTGTVSLPTYLAAAWFRQLNAAEAAWWYRSGFDLIARRRGRVGWEAALAATTASTVNVIISRRKRNI